MNLVPKVFIALIIFISYLGVIILAPMHMVHMSEMNMPMENCPFGFGEHFVCHMSMTEHSNSWNSFLQSVVFPFKDLNLPLFTISLIFSLFIIPKLHFYLKRQRVRRIISLYQSLFAVGILNPKLF